ncbi:MAG: hypothetical protein V7603_2212 [Micromonosporaceae bacterium]
MPVTLAGGPPSIALADGTRLDMRAGTASAMSRGRNRTAVHRTTGGVPVFVKVLHGDPAEVAARWHRTVTFERLVARPGAVPGLLSPRCLGWDEQSATLVFEDLTGAVAFDAPTGDAASDALAAGAGRVVAALHEVDTRLPGWDRVDRTPPQRPELELLDALTLTAYLAASAAQLQLWALLQADRPVVDALHRLRARERTVPHRPVHGDLRPDQFLRYRDRLHLTDWEDFRIADPARDIGNMAGSWLYRAVLAGGGTTALGRARRRIAAFWRGYVSGRGVPDAGFATRATAYAGWHQYDMSTALAARHSRLTGTAFATAGLGRQLLLDPGRLAATIGLGGASSN